MKWKQTHRESNQGTKLHAQNDKQRTSPPLNHIQEGGSNTAISPTPSPKTKKRTLYQNMNKHVTHHDKQRTKPPPNHIQKDGSNTAISPTTSPKTKKQALWTQWVRALIYVQKPSKPHPNIAPKMVQNPSKIDPWDPLEPLTEPRSVFRPFWDPFWTSKGTQNW